MLFAQQYSSKLGEVSFFSSAKLEDIKADNNKMNGIIDMKTGQFAFKVAINEFVFANSLMQEHFNENYLESDKFPYATFVGKILNHSLVKEGDQQVEVSGIMNIHGVENEMIISSLLNKTKNEVSIFSNFNIKLVDHNIKIPKIVMYKIAEEIAVNIKMKLIEK
jgi:polyisoprenoid-binding protein YceI